MTRTCVFMKRHTAGVTKDGRAVYHTLRWCNRIRREFWFTLDPAGICGERSGQMGAHFDARTVPPAHRTYGRPPIDWVLSALNAGWQPATLAESTP